MPPFGRSKAAGVAQELVDHLKLIDNVKALQEGQKEIVNAISRINDRINSIESDLKLFKSEVKHEALKEATATVLSVQSEFNSRIQDMAVKVAVLESVRTIGGSPTVRQIGRQDPEKVDGFG